MRMAHRMLTQQIHAKCPPALSVESFAPIVRHIQKLASTAEVVVADDVAKYVQQIGKPTQQLHGGVELALAPSDFPNITPPFERLLIEWVPVEDNHDVRQAAILMHSTSTEDALKYGFVTQDRVDEQVDPAVLVSVWHLYCSHAGNLVYDGNFLTYFVNSKGSLASENMRRVEGADFHHVPLAVPLMTISLMHCKNVAKRDATASFTPSDKWMRRNKIPASLPQVRYHVLDINPMKEVLRTEGGIEANGPKKAMHICRGHFVNYTEEKPLFGRMVGTFWKPSHVRGSAEHGIVDKDYRIKTGTGQ